MVVGGNCGVYEGTIVRARRCIGAGVILTGSTPVYDLVRGQIYPRRRPSAPLEIPDGAVVVPGARLSRRPRSGWGLSIDAPIIVKYRDEQTDARTALEEGLR